MTVRRDGLEQGYVMHQVHQRTICSTPGCYTFVVDHRTDMHLCLACQLDHDVPLPRLGRPPKVRADESESSPWL